MGDTAARVTASEPNRTAESPPKGEEEEEEEEESTRLDDAALATAPGASKPTPTGASAVLVGVEGHVLKVGDEHGIRKKLLKEGEGWETPVVGDEVEVQYTGTLLDGTKFDSSHDRGESFKFKLGQGQVIKGWDHGIRTMKKGENAVFTIPPELAYGATGSPPTIPPNASLQFDIVLLSWANVKDGGIFKKILKEGEKWKKPKDAIHEARLEDGTVVSKSEGVEVTLKDEIGDDKKILKKVLEVGEGYERPSEGAAFEGHTENSQMTGKAQADYLSQFGVQIYLMLPIVEGQHHAATFRLSNPMQQSSIEDIPQSLLADKVPMAVMLKFLEGNQLIESVQLEQIIDGQEDTHNVLLQVNLAEHLAVLSILDAQTGNWKSTSIYSLVAFGSPMADDSGLLCYRGISNDTTFYPMNIDFKKDIVTGEHIGTGAYGSVYKCSRGDFQFAVKKLRKPFSRSLCSEVLSMLKLIGSKNVVQMYSAWMEEATSGATYVYIAMELFERNLDDYLQVRPEVDLQENKQIFTEIMLGVQSMHQARIIHRDLKPHNILLDTDGHVAIADFGMAKIIPEGTSVVCFPGRPIYGTQYYADPDLNSGEYDEKVDIYSCGIIYLEMHFFTQRRKHIRDFTKKYLHRVKNKGYDLWNSSIFEGWEGDKLMMKHMVARMNRPDASYFLENLEGEDD